VQYLGNAAWYGVGVNRWPIGNQPSFMLYRLVRSPLTQHDWKVKDRFGFVRSANSAQAQSLLLCPALSYSAPRKSWGRRNLCPPLLKCFRHHCICSIGIDISNTLSLIFWQYSIPVLLSSGRLVNSVKTTLLCVPERVKTRTVVLHLNWILLKYLLIDVMLF